MLLSAYAGLLLSACAGPGSGPPLPESYTPPPVETAEPPRTEPRPSRPISEVPAWVGGKASAERLEEIAGWLESDGYRADPYWVAEGHLQLAEGRVQQARHEPRSAAVKIVQARTGFDRVLASPDATDAQRQRARLGLAAAGEPFARTAADPVPGDLLPRRTWGARPELPRRLSLADASWRWITVHHSAMEGARPLDGSLSDSAHAIREIQAAHMNGGGYGDIGYHYLIDPAGRVFEGRDLRWQGAHAGGSNNVGNVGVCLLGNFEVEHPTPEALAALDELVSDLCSTHAIPPRCVVGHRNWKNTQCPGRHLADHLATYH